MTYLQIVNSVLKRLREDTVTTVTENTISSLVGELVNTIKDEVELAWKWNVLRNTITLSTSNGTYRYVLTGAGTQSIIQDVWNDTDDLIVRNISPLALNHLFIESNVQTGSPYFYGINGSDSNGDLQVDLYPIPDAVYSVDFNLILKQADLSADADVLLVPSNVVVLGAWALAISERGEDGGVSFNEIDSRYRLALGDAISIDAGNMHFSETEWTVR